MRAGDSRLRGARRYLPRVTTRGDEDEGGTYEHRVYRLLEDAVRDELGVYSVSLDPRWDDVSIRRVPRLLAQSPLIVCPSARPGVHAKIT